MQSLSTSFGKIVSKVHFHVLVSYEVYYNERIIKVELLTMFNLVESWGNLTSSSHYGDKLTENICGT